MNQLEYRPGLGGAAVQMDDYPAFVGTAENLRSREWAYTLGYRDLVSANRPAREVEVDFYTDYRVANALRRVADADVMAKTPGTFVAQGEWRQRGYILSSQPSGIHFGRLMANMRVALLDGAWWRKRVKSFNVESEEGKNQLDISKDLLKSYNTLGTWTDDTYSYRGIDATLNDDGSITLNGEATGNYTLYLVPTTAIKTLPVGDYWLFGSIPNGNDSHWYLQVTTVTDSSGTLQVRYRDYGDGVHIEVNAQTYGIASYFHAAKYDAFDNAVLRPYMVAGGLLNYPHDYEYDYVESSSTNTVETSVLTPSNINIIIYGPATNPAITIGGNVYQVNTTVPSGGYLTIDGREKTIVLTLANGTTQNAFAYGLRGTGAGGGSYIFEPIKSGLQSVSWDGSFGFDLGWYEEEGEPPWNLS